ncbi:MAG: type II 3-dehydroquinate dehydratase [Candidatus Margulisbacteria bacterium]|nr:type II 3-dehydroquinate dehydratase [Candidatus Margulisiibacteriota bacterium]
MGKKIKLLIINGPNLNLLGEREPVIYGKETLKDLESYLNKKYKDKVIFSFFQSNVEGEIIDKIQEAKKLKVQGIIINAGAYTHYSLAIHDALKSVNVPAVEVHLSNIYKRETKRHESAIAPAVVGQISGFHFKSYMLAVEYFLQD